MVGQNAAGDRKGACTAVATDLFGAKIDATYHARVYTAARGAQLCNEHVRLLWCEVLTWKLWDVPRYRMLSLPPALAPSCEQTTVTGRRGGEDRRWFLKADHVHEAFIQTHATGTVAVHRGGSSAVRLQENQYARSFAKSSRRNVAFFASSVP